MRSFGRWAPAALGVLALVALVAGLFTGNEEMVILGAVGAAALLIGFPVAERLLGKDESPD
jgi:hypothetical protein